MTEALTRGTHHVGLSVSDLDATSSFFCDTLGFAVAGEVPDYPAKFVSDGTTLITLWQVANPETAMPFDRKTNVGLHHLALAVADDAALDAIFERLQAHPDVAMEFAPGPISEGSRTRHCICAIPGGIRVEFATPFA